MANLFFGGEGDVFQTATPAPPIPQRKPDVLSVNDIGAPEPEAGESSHGLMIAFAVGLALIFFLRS